MNQEASIAERALLYPAWVVCGIPPNNIRILFPADLTNARGRAIHARFYYFSGYPKEFYNNERINMNGCTGDLWEFPVLAAGDVYGNTNNWSPGMDRVIIDCQGNLCAVVTHTGAPVWPPNGFVPCSYYY